MRNELKKYILSAHIVLMVLLFSACNGKSKTSFMQEGGDTLNLRYAENLQIIKYQHYTQVTLRNPWDTLKTLHTYLLVNKQDSCPSSLPEGTIVRVPLSNSLIFSSVHCGLLQELGALDKIKGVCDLQYIRVPAILESCRKNRCPTHRKRSAVEGIHWIRPAGRYPWHPGAHNGSSGCSRCQSRRRRWHPGAGRRS